MGSDDLFKKRKAKETNLQRQRSKRESYPRILLVCEGSCTEPQYFHAAVDHYELHTTNVKIYGDGGSAPSAVYRYGRELYEQAKREKNPYDRVYFVFDRDQHACFERTCQTIQAQKPANTFFAITSIPCIEFWFLLHYEYSTSPERAKGIGNKGKLGSSADGILKRLREYWPEYAKAGTDTFGHLLPALPRAIYRASKLTEENRNTGESNPSTRMHELMQTLRDLKTLPASSSDQ